MDQVISIDADVFIIPNKYRMVRDCPTYTRNYFKKVAKLNNIAITSIDKIVDVWFLSTDIDNLTNGFDMIVEGRNYYFGCEELGYIPSDLFDGITEGGNVNYVVPVKAIETESGTEVNMIFDITMTCQQQGYRYGALGTFEEVLRKMTNGSKDEKSEDAPVPKNISIASSNLNETKKDKKPNKVKRGNLKMETQTININADIFVIPTHAAALGLYCNYTKKYLMDLVKLNNIDLTIDDKIVEVWFTSKELESENLSDHGFTVNLDGYTIDVTPYNLKFVPAKILTGVAEGDVITYKAPAKAYVNNNDAGIKNKEVEVIIEISMTLRQKEYRYANCGTFEETLEKVTAEKSEYQEQILDGLKEALNATDAVSEKYENIDKKEEDEKGKSIMKSIKETWNNLPKSVKIGAKVIVGAAVIAGVAYAGNEGYKRYIKKDESVEDTDIIVPEDSNVVVVDDKDEDIVVVVAE